MKRELISGGSPYEDIVGFSRAVRVGPYITIGGTAPINNKGNTVGIGDVSVQTKQCLETIKMALEKAGSSLDDVVRTRMLLTNIDDWKSVADTSTKIARSYILEQKLTPAQKTELNTSLPEHFKRLDAQFHLEAKKLEAAALNHDAQLATFHYYRLIETCTACHKF